MPVVSSLKGNYEKIKEYMKLLVAQPCLTLWDPMDCSPPGCSVHGIFQARPLEWIGIPFSRGPSWLRNWIQVSHIVGRVFTMWAVAPKRMFMKTILSNPVSKSFSESKRVNGMKLLAISLLFIFWALEKSVAGTSWLGRLKPSQKKGILGFGSVRVTEVGCWDEVVSGQAFSEALSTVPEAAENQQKRREISYPPWAVVSSRRLGPANRCFSRSSHLGKLVTGRYWEVRGRSEEEANAHRCLSQPCSPSGRMNLILSASISSSPRSGFTKAGSSLPSSW